MSPDGPDGDNKWEMIEETKYYNVIQLQLKKDPFWSFYEMFWHMEAIYKLKYD